MRMVAVMRMVVRKGMTVRVGVMMMTVMTTAPQLWVKRPVRKVTVMKVAPRIVAKRITMMKLTDQQKVANGVNAICGIFLICA